MRKILIVSGWIGGEKIFAPIVKEFEDREIEFICFAKISSNEKILETVKKGIKKFNPDVIIAWSMGTLAVLKVLESIEVKSKLILVSSTSKFIKNSYGNLGWKIEIIDSMMKSLKANKILTIKKFCENMIYKSELEYTTFVMDNLEIEDSYIESLLKGLLFLKSVEAIYINKIKNHTLIIHGENDFICNIKGAQYINSKLKNSFLKIIENCGHIPFITKEKEFTNILNIFLGES